MRYLGKEKIMDILTDELTIVDFFAEWCGPCMMLGPVLEDLEKEDSSIKIVKVNTDEHEEEARSYGIMSIPTLILYKNKKPVDKIIGFQSLEELKMWIEKNKNQD